MHESRNRFQNFSTTLIATRMNSAANSRPIAATAVLLLLFLAPGTAFADVTWNHNEVNVIQQAQRNNRPIIFFFARDERPGRKAKNNNLDKVRHGIKGNFTLPQIEGLATEVFETFAADFKVNGALMAKLKVKLTPNDIVITTPELDVLEHINSTPAQDPKQLLAALKRCATKWGDRVYAADIKPDLVGSDTPDARRQKALTWVQKAEYEKAVDDVIALLGQETLSGKIRTLAHQTLADLSTEKAIRKLMSDADTHVSAEVAPRKCEGAAIDTLLTYLKGEPDADFQRAFRLLAVRLKVPSSDEAFWKTATAEQRENEVERIRNATANLRERE